MKPWIHEKLTEILGFEDDVVIDYAINQLEETNHPDPKAVQINLTGFLNAKVTKKIKHTAVNRATPLAYQIDRTQIICLEIHTGII